MSKTGIPYQMDNNFPGPCSVAARQSGQHQSFNEPQYNLSKREIEIMQWLKIGKSNQEIACILDICTCTVKNHLQRIFRKLLVFNRTHAVAKFFINTQDFRN